MFKFWYHKVWSETLSQYNLTDSGGYYIQIQILFLISNRLYYWQTNLITRFSFYFAILIFLIEILRLFFRTKLHKTDYFEDLQRFLKIVLEEFLDRQLSQKKAEPVSNLSFYHFDISIFWYINYMILMNFNRTQYLFSSSTIEQNLSKQ